MRDTLPLSVANALLEWMPERVDRFLDLGTGDGRLIDVVLGAHPACRAVGLDFSPVMVDAARRRFAGDGRVREIGFTDVDCHWKWREVALLAGVRPE